MDFQKRIEATHTPKRVTLKPEGTEYLKSSSRFQRLLMRIYESKRRARLAKEAAQFRRSQG